MNKEIVICNPPVGFTTNNKTHIGHLFFHTILDTTARFKASFMNRKVSFPARAYNLYGLPSQRYMEDNKYTPDEYRSKVKEIIDEDWKVRNINLINNDLIFDDSPEVRKYIPTLFQKLSDKKALIVNNDEIFLDFSKINFEDLSHRIKSTRIFPERVKEMLLFHLKNNTTTPYKISSTRWFTPDSHIEGIKVSPTFVVSTFWDAYFPNADFILACSFNLVLKSALLRIVTHYLAFGDIGISELIVFPKIIGDVPKRIPLDTISNHALWKDLLRFSFLFSYTSKREKVLNDIASHKGSISFAKDMLNLYEKRIESSDLKIEETREYQKYLESMDTHEYRTAISSIRGLIKIMRNKKGTSNHNIAILLKMVSPIMPFFSDKLQNVLTSNEKLKDSEISVAKIDEYLSVIQGNVET